MAILHRDFAEFLRLLNAHEVKYLVVGGYAVALHGYPRYTGDLDIFVEASPENATRLVEVYRMFGIDQPGLNTSLFTTPGNVVRVGSEPVRLEVLTRITGVSFEDAFARRVEVVLDDLTVSFISYEDLIKNKESTGRGKDRVDADALKKRSQQ
jgi:predicted nucleotidyltransferase